MASRDPTGSHIVHIRMPNPVLELLDDIAGTYGTNRSSVVKTCISAVLPILALVAGMKEEPTEEQEEVNKDE